MIEYSPNKGKNFEQPIIENNAKYYLKYWKLKTATHLSLYELLYSY